MPLSKYKLQMLIAMCRLGQLYELHPVYLFKYYANKFYQSVLYNNPSGNSCNLLGDNDYALWVWIFCIIATFLWKFYRIPM